MRIRFKRRAEGKKLKGKSGSKLARRMWKQQLRDQYRSRRLKANAGKATKPGYLGTGQRVPWGAF